MKFTRIGFSVIAEKISISEKGEKYFATNKD